MSSEIQFDIDATLRAPHREKESKFIALVIEYSFGLIRNKTHANYVLILFSIFAIIASFLLIFKSSEKPYQPTQAEIIRIMNLRK